MTTALVPLDTLGAEIKARIAAGDKALDKAEQHYIAAGIQLIEAQKRLAETREMKWSAFLFSQARVSRETARKYMMLADGKTSLDEIREGDRQRQQKSREARRSEGASKQISRDVTGKVSQQDQVAPADDGSEIDRLKAQIAAQAAEIEDLKKKLANAEEKAAENASLAAMREVRATEAEAQRDKAQYEALFYKSDKEHLQGELEDARKKIDKLTEAYYSQVDTFRKHIRGPHIDHYVEGSISEFEDEARIRFDDVIAMVEMAGYSRIGEFFNLHCNKSDLDVGPQKWVQHRSAVLERIAEKSCPPNGEASTASPPADNDDFKPEPFLTRKR